MLFMLMVAGVDAVLRSLDKTKVRNPPEHRCKSTALLEIEYILYGTIKCIVSYHNRHNRYRRHVLGTLFGGKKDGQLRPFTCICYVNVIHQCTINSKLSRGLNGWYLYHTLVET